ncbi:MAG: hypothetical protein LBD68_03250 [Zoogloeaceae bacterium]|nr:hypothetical protein [Zoogloeaceae bacterium]
MVPGVALSPSEAAVAVVIADAAFHEDAGGQRAQRVFRVQRAAQQEACALVFDAGAGTGFDVVAPHGEKGAEAKFGGGFVARFLLVQRREQMIRAAGEGAQAGGGAVEIRSRLVLVDLSPQRGGQQFVVFQRDVEAVVGRAEGGDGGGDGAGNGAGASRGIDQVDALAHAEGGGLARKRHGDGGIRTQIHAVAAGEGENALLLGNVGGQGEEVVFKVGDGGCGVSEPVVQMQGVAGAEIAG